MLGQGGMAAVWAGTNERTGKRVALKVILRSLAKMSVVQGLFHSEVLAASRVNHPNVVTVFDVIQHEGMACIVMELLDGEPLGSYIARRGFLSVNEATALLLPAMRGVAAANAQGVIHRDLKPQNIFICMEPDGRIVTTKVLDFGISIMVERGMDSSAGPKMAMGTPAYMSPEHILGVPDIDGRADVYGFGVLLYEALTGQTPFPGEPSPTLFDRVLYRPAPPVAAMRPDLPPRLVRIIERAMAKDRDQRYADVNMMVMALEDELMPPMLPPRSLTPLTGVPSFVAHDSLSGTHGSAVEAILRKEPSVQHQAKKMFFAFPVETDSKESAAHGGPNAGSKGGPEELQPPATWDRDKTLVVRKGSLRMRRFLGIGARFALPGRAGLASVVFAVITGVLAVSVAVLGARRVQSGTPASIANVTQPTRGPVVLSAVPAVISTATVDPVAVAPLTASPSPTASGALATRELGQSVRHTRAMPVRLTPVHSRVAVTRASTDLPPGRQAQRRASRGYALSWASSAARRTGTSAKFAEPRAGHLSKEDF
jgi:serine/threonine protein kinase